MSLVLIIILVLLLIGAFPTRGYGGGAPVNGTLGFVLLILIILLLLGKI